MRQKLKISQRSYPSPVDLIESIEEPISMVEDEILNQPMVEDMIDHSYVIPELAEKREERTILDEPMVAKAMELFAPKRVRVKRRS